jgi:hypothetical protein
MKSFKDPVISQLISELLNEPFSKARDFAKKDMDAVCSEIESEGYLFSTGDSLGADFDSEKNSFEKSRDLICLLLIQFDLLGVTEMPEGPLQNLVSSDFDPSQFSCPFLATAEYLKHLKTSDNFPIETLVIDKMIAQNLCLSFEKDLAKTLEEPLLLLWPMKDQIIRECVSTAEKKVELSPEWMGTLDKALENGSIPFSRGERSKLFLETFRLIANSGSEPRLCFSLPQMGALILLLAFKTSFLPVSEIAAGKFASLIFQMEHKKQQAQNLELVFSADWLIQVGDLRNTALEHLEEMRSLPQSLNEAA